jgi:hypothetical protein
MMGCFEDSTEHFGSSGGGNSIDWLSKYVFIKKKSVPWS